MMMLRDGLIFPEITACPIGNLFSRMENHLCDNNHCKTGEMMPIGPSPDEHHVCRNG
jgi:hypothetical protein